MVRGASDLIPCKIRIRIVSNLLDALDDCGTWLVLG